MNMLRKLTSKLLSQRLPRAATSILLVGAIALPAGAGTAIALAASGDTSAVAINTKDGSSAFKLTFGVRQVNGSVVDPQNAAVAVSSCADCQTVAISVEVVLAGGDATTVAPVNEAIAINESCTSCDTLAAAYQFVEALGTKLMFTAEGRQQLAEIRQQLEQLRNSGLTIEQISTEVGVLMNQLGNVLNTQLIGVTQPAAGPGAGTATTTASPTSSTPTDTTTTPTSAPTGTTTTPTSTPPETITTPSATPTDTTSGGTNTSPTTPTSTTTTTSPTTTTNTTPTVTTP